MKILHKMQNNKFCGSDSKYFFGIYKPDLIPSLDCIYCVYFLVCYNVMQQIVHVKASWMYKIKHVLSFILM